MNQLTVPVVAITWARVLVHTHTHIHAPKRPCKKFGNFCPASSQLREIPGSETEEWTLRWLNINFVGVFCTRNAFWFRVCELFEIWCWKCVGLIEQKINSTWRWYTISYKLYMVDKLVVFEYGNRRYKRSFLFLLLYRFFFFCWNPI